MSTADSDRVQICGKNYNGVTDESVLNKEKGNEQAINDLGFNAPNCTTKAVNAEGKMKVGLGFLFNGGTQVNTTTSSGCQNFTKMVNTYNTTQCQITKILNSVSVKISQNASNTQNISFITGVGATTVCSNVVMGNSNAGEMKSVNEVTVQTKTDIKNLLESKVKEIFEYGVNTIIDGSSDPGLGNQVIKEFNESISNEMFNDIANDISVKLKQTFNNTQNIQFINYGNYYCALDGSGSLGLYNSNIFDIQSNSSVESAMETAISQTTFSESLYDFNQTFEKEVDSTIPPLELADDNPGFKWLLIIVGIGIAIAMIVAVIYFLSKPKKAKAVSSMAPSSAGISPETIMSLANAIPKT